MKVLVLLLASVALCAGSALPLTPGDNSHFVPGESRYIWMPDDENVAKLVDLEEPVDELALAEARRGADNAYWLFTRRNPHARQVIIHDNVNSVRNSHYNGNRPLKVIAHGWNNNGGSPVNNYIRDAFLANSDCNVIVLDWSRLANQAYRTAVNGVPDVGRHLGRFIEWLISAGGGNWNRVHFVGHSLGAHLVGNAGRQVRGRAVRVTGLDPARLYWVNSPNALNRNDGVYVEAIHTDGHVLGIMNPIANADFYPNGGKNPQPGCGLNNACSHGRAFQFFASSVRTNHFVGRQCRNVHEAELSTCTGAQFRMGNADLGKRGNGLFGLRTGANWPF